MINFSNKSIIMLYSEIIKETFKNQDITSTVGFEKYRKFIDNKKVFLELKKSGIIDNNNKLKTTRGPYNFFTKIVSGIIIQDELIDDNLYLKDTPFMVVSNRKSHDINYDKPELVKKASMSKYHKFITIKNLNWKYFNISTFEANEFNLNLLIELKKQSIEYTKRNEGWSDNIGLYFHPFGFNSVNSLHLHMIDLDHVGPAFEYNNYKNVSLDVAIFVMELEIYNNINNYFKLLVLIYVIFMIFSSLILLNF
jgi:hypothetical protein